MNNTIKSLTKNLYSFCCNSQFILGFTFVFLFYRNVSPFLPHTARRTPCLVWPPDRRLVPSAYYKWQRFICHLPPVVAAVRAFLRENCPYGWWERHVVTILAMSPRQKSSDTLPLCNRCTHFPVY